MASNASQYPGRYIIFGYADEPRHILVSHQTDLAVYHQRLVARQMYGHLGRATSLNMEPREKIKGIAMSVYE